MRAAVAVNTIGRPTFSPTRIAVTRRQRPVFGHADCLAVETSSRTFRSPPIACRQQRYRGHQSHRQHYGANERDEFGYVVLRGQQGAPEGRGRDFFAGQEMAVIVPVLAGSETVLSSESLRFFGAILNKHWHPGRCFVILPTVTAAWRLWLVTCRSASDTARPACRTDHCIVNLPCPWKLSFCR